VADLYERQKEYYDRRAREYDEVWQSTELRGPEIEELVARVAALPPARTLDVACGTGFLSQHLPGEVTLLDASNEMLAIASARVPEAATVQSDALPLPFDDASFDRVFTSHFFGHLRSAERMRFLTEARRVASEIVVVDQTAGPEHREGMEARKLNDGTEHEIYKTYFSADSLLAELDDGELLHSGRVFLMVRS
jgi:ubiquinone/menaquinone biosynthesis C-methylase UbiE